MHKFLVETALIGQGLPSVSDSDLCSNPALAASTLIWLDKGKPLAGTLDEFLPLRRHARQLHRISRRALDQARKNGLTAFLTASAAMQVCAELGVGLAVTAGMGGVGPRPSSAVGEDLLALAELPVSLIAAAPKDVFNHQATFRWLRDAGVCVRGVTRAVSDGFLCRSQAVSLDGPDNGTASPPLLLLNPIPHRGRCISSAVLAAAMAEGESAEKEGREYHPAVNAALDRLSGSQSSRWQLASLCENIVLADVRR